MRCGSPTICRLAWRPRSAPATSAAPIASLRACNAGIVWINDHHRLDPASPWGGVGDSGVGREFGTESFDDHFNVKSVMVATARRSRSTGTATRRAQRRLN